LTIDPLRLQIKGIEVAKNNVLKLMMKDYGHISPLVSGDVVAEGIDLFIERDSPNALDRTLSDSSIGAGELSLSRHLSRLAQGDKSFVGIPVFPSRSFRHRCFFVRRGSELTSLEQLQGKRIGCNEWPATGNTWSRAALRHAGVRIEDIRWSVGSIDGAPSSRPQGVLPSNVQAVTDKTLLSMLLAGELDALMCPVPPKGFYAEGSPVIRLLRDFRQAEMNYYRETGIFPIFHIVGVRRDVYQQDPDILRRLFKALEDSKRRWQANRKQLADLTPWTLAEIEDTTALFGEDWSPYGVEQNLKVIQMLCDEQLAQGLVSKRQDAAQVFPEFEASFATS
jgi:4,5-dihydroxyphthalate decarboxylase